MITKKFKKEFLELKKLYVLYCYTDYTCKDLECVIFSDSEEDIIEFKRENLELYICEECFNKEDIFKYYHKNVLPEEGNYTLKFYDEGEFETYYFETFEELKNYVKKESYDFEYYWDCISCEVIDPNGETIFGIESVSTFAKQY
ncbi:MAG: hypothetical protein LBM05_00540 [Endomicrobium sp.]|jgi:hypothetical protein|nr:hypothetical protein [Endomicrobium sp.]